MVTSLRISCIALALIIMQVPPNLQVPTGNKLSFHVFAKGFQIYRCTADKSDSNHFSWVFVAPAADLYIHPNDMHPVGRHYAGPTWESLSGSKVVGTVIDHCTPDPDAIPWLLLGAASNEGHGIFQRANYIQRLNTVGGNAPTVPGDFPGQVARVPYTAQYFFYRADH